MTEALSEFKSKSGSYPENLILYRDGVGDSQQKAVLLYELPQIKAAISKLIGKEEAEANKIKVMVVLVNKRVN